MSVSSDSRPHEAVDSGGLPITRDRETAIPSQPIEHDTEPEAMKLSTTAIADTVAAQEAKEAGAEDVVDIPAEVKPLDGVERVAGAVDDKAETGVDSDEFRETALVPPKHTDFASETVQVTESDSTDSTLIESEEPREDTKEAVAIASTTPSTIEAREVVGVQDTKEEEKVADGQFESAHAEGVTAQGIALSPTQESTSDAQRATGNTPATDPLTIQLDAVKPVEGVILSESFDSLSSNQAAKSSEEGPEIPIESEMTFASPVSPVSVARTVSVAGEESVPGTPISETYSDTGTRASTPGPEDGDAPRARTKAEKKRAKRLRQKQASKDAATMKAELDVAQIAVPAIPTAVGEVKEHSVPIEEQPSALARESAVETPPPVEGMPEVIKEEVVPTEEEGVKETKPNPVEIQVEETVAEPTPTISNDERKIEAAVEGHTPFLEEVPQAELPVENVPEVEAAVVEPVIEEAPKVEAVVEDTAPEIEVAPKIEPVAKEPVPVVAEALDPVAEEVAKVEEPPKNEEVKEPLRADEDIKVEEPTKVKEETEVAEEKPPKPEEEVKVEEEIKDEEPTKIEEKEPSKAEVEVKIEEPAKVQDEIKAEEPVKREEDAKAEEPVKTEEGAKVDQALRAEAPAEEPSVIEQTREASSEGLALATEEATSAGEVAIEEVPKVVSEGYHPLVEPVKEEQAVEAAPAPFAEESKDVEATDDKVHEVQPSSAQAKPEVPDDVETGFVEPLSTPALPEDAKATIPKTLEAVKEVAPSVEEVEPKAIVAATAEKLEIPAGIVEPIASPAYGEGHVEEREPIAQQLDAALEDIKVEEVAEEIVTAPEEVKQEEEPATEVSKEVESEILLPVEEGKEVEPEVTPAVETKREPVPVVEESKAEEPIEVVSEPPVVEETKETAIIEQPVVEEEVEPKEVSTDDVVKEEEPAVEASVGQPIVEKAALEVEKASQPAVEEPIILAEEVNEVPVEPTLVVARQEVVEPAKIEEAIVPQEETSVADVEEVVEAVNAQPTETVEDVKRVAPIEEKVVEPITDAVSEIPLPTSAPQETEPEREVVGAIAHTATSTESADSPLEPITPAVVVQDLEPVQDKEAAPISQTLERPRSPFSPSFTVTTIGGSAVEAPVEENPEETAAALVADNSKQSELPPPRPWTPSYSVHSQGSPLQPKATLGDDVPAEPLSKEAPEAEQVAKDVTPEQPEVPAEALIEAAVEEPVQPTAEISTKEAEAPAVLALEEARGSVANITAPVPLIAPIPLAGSSWVPSYSVSRQGSPLPKTPQPVEKSLPLEEPAAQVPVAAESFWNGVKAVEDDSKPIHSTEIQVPKSAVLRDAPATEPTIAPATESLVPPETPPRARLESNSSTSKLLPGGWFSPRKGSHDSRPSLETASVLPPIATENLSVPSPEMGQNSASPSKKRWCTIM